MKILHVIPSVGTARGGPSVVVRSMARAQAIRGMDVHIATTDDNGPNRMAVQTDGPVKDGNLTIWFFRRQTRFYTFSFPLTRWLWRNAGLYDVIHIHALFSYPSIAAAICAAGRGTPFVVRPLGTLGQWGMRNRRRWLKSFSFWCVESRILKYAAAVQYTCEQEASEANLLGAEHQGVVIPNPVELTGAICQGSLRSRYAFLEGKIILLFLSRLDPKKGIDLLLPAFSAARLRNPNTILVVAGDGQSSFVDDLKRRARSLGIEDCVLWTGFLEGKEKLAAFADADLFILPSYSENFGVAVVEAMGAGIPVIVSDQVGIHREILQAGAGLVVECRVAALEQALTRAIADSEWRVCAGEKAAQLAARYSPEAIGAQLTELYTRIQRTNARTAAA